MSHSHSLALPFPHFPCLSFIVLISLPSSLLILSLSLSSYSVQSNNRSLSIHFSLASSPLVNLIAFFSLSSPHYQSPFPHFFSIPFPLLPTSFFLVLCFPSFLFFYFASHIPWAFFFLVLFNFLLSFSLVHFLYFPFILTPPPIFHFLHFFSRILYSLPFSTSSPFIFSHISIS